MASTLTTFDALLKERYDTRKVEDLTMADRPFMAMIPKDEDFTGDGHVVPLIHVNPQGVAAASLATAQSNSSNQVSKKFTLTPGDYFGTVDIGDKVMTFSRNNAGAFLQNKIAETDGLHEQMADSLAIHMWGNGGGALGQRASISGDTVTLSDPSDVFAFEEGMGIVASSADGDDASDALRTGSDAVASVDREAGTVTLVDETNITSFANDDFLFRQGDFFGNTGAGIIKGVQAYITATASPAALFGMTRTSDPQRLAGSRVASADLTGLNIEERIQKLGAYMTGRYKGPGPDCGFLHPEDWQDLAIQLQSRGYRPLKEEVTRFGFMALETIVGGKTVKIYSERYVPKGTFFAFLLKNWRLHSPGKLITPLNGDGLTMLRKSTTNDYEFRLKAYPQMSCNAPGWQGRVPLP